ncbi:MAG: hypothetical protein ACYC8T_05145 [Myxococcaceae bacterium]
MNQPLLAIMAMVLLGCPRPSEFGDAGPCPANEFRDPATGRCAALPSCQVTSDCSGGASCVGGVCSSCGTNILCSAGFAACNPSLGKCVGCLSSADCSGGLPVCGAPGCVQCAADTDCSAPMPFCEDSRCVGCKSGSDCAPGQSCHVAGFCSSPCSSDAECSSPQPVCGMDTLCRECFATTDCAAGNICFIGRCEPALPGEDCRVPIDLDLSAGSVTVAGDLSRYHGNSELIVSAAYRIVLAEEAALNGELTVNGLIAGAGFEIDLGGCASTVQLAASTSGANGQEIRGLYLAKGTYMVRVLEQGRATGGDYTLHLWTTPASRAAGNSCLKPIPVILDAANTARLQGTTAGLEALEGRQCTSPIGTVPRLTYSLELASRSSVFVTVTPQDPNFAVAVRVGASCFVEGYNSCPSQLKPGQPVSFQTYSTPLAAGTQAIVIEDVGGTSGSFTLDVRVIPWMSNDTCETAASLQFVAGVATASGDTTYSNPGNCTCNLMSCNYEVAYVFSTAGLGPHSIHIAVASLDGGEFQAAALETQCGYLGGEVLACHHWGSNLALLDYPRLAEGTYYVQVGANRGGPFALTATLGPAFPLPPNDTCAVAPAFDLSAGTASASGDTRGASDNLAGSCGASGVGPDVAYRVVSSARGLATLTLTPTGAGYQPILLQYRDCTSSSEAQCVASPAPAAPASLQALVDSTGFIAWVDGVAQTTGPFTLTGQLTPSPANDACAGATPIARGQTLSGDISAAFPDPANPCSSAYPLGDLYYQFTASANGTAAVTVTPSGFNANIAAMSNCGSLATCVGFANSGGIGSAETLTFPVARNASYVIQVSTSAGRGGFTIGLQY